VGALIGGILAWLLLPLLLGRATGYPGWWAVSPLGRWARIALATTVLWFILFIGLPTAGEFKLAPPELALATYPGVPADYLQCAGVQFQSDGTVLGGMNAPDRPAVGQLPALLLGMVLSMAAWSVLYWLVFRMWRNYAGLRRRVTAGGRA
jgi:hypothetical protein